MKKEACIVLALIFVILISSSVFAFSISDFFKNLGISGKVTEENQTPIAVQEQVKCLFTNTNTEQKCYGEIFVCEGIGSCIADVSGEQGKIISWKSSCGGYASTTIDGSNEEITFACETPIPITTTPTSTLEIKEQVKCIFTNTDTEQKCYGSDGRFGCTGMGSCIADVSGVQGAQVTWKSSCGGYAYTTIDGNNEYAEFRCEQATITAPIPVENVKEQVKCLFADSVSEQKCYGGEFTCTGTGSCTAEVSGEKGKMLSWKSSCGGYSYTLIDGNNEYAEFNCEQVQTPMSTTPIAIQEVKEQIQCIFLNSNVLITPHTSTEKCYTDDGKFGCVWDGNVMTEEGGKRTAYCTIMNVEGGLGEKLVWKSSCGGYAYSVIDGNNERVEFSCIQSANVTVEQISGKGFDKAYWQCYDGLGTTADAIEGVSCNSGEVWQEYAAKTCSGHCKTYDAEGVTKCGVNSYSVSGECYIDQTKGAVFISSSEAAGGGGKKIVMPPTSKTGDIMLVYFYSDGCSHCIAMEDELKKVSETGITITRVNTASDAELVKSYEINAVPTLMVLKYREDGIQEIKRAGKADSSFIIHWVNSIKGKNIPVETEKSKIEEILICKDSCPLDGKCYPFGYRKTGKFCSDSGSFILQLKDDSSCDNNFECSTNLCIDGQCISSGMIQKMLRWFKKIFGGDENGKIIDCGANIECWENAFKECKPAKITREGGSQEGGLGGLTIEIIGLKDEKCVVKWTAKIESSKKSMTCKFEGYSLGTSNIRESLEQNCEGELAYWLASPLKMAKAPVPISAVNETK